MSNPSDSNDTQPRFEPRLVEFRGIFRIRLCDAVELLLESPHATRVALIGVTSDLSIHWIKKRFPETPQLRWKQLKNPHSFCFSVFPKANLPTVDLTLSLAALDQDDVIAFLLDHSPKSCQSVIARLNSKHYQWIGSDLCIWSQLLLRLAADEKLSVEEVLWNWLRVEIDEHFNRRYGQFSRWERYRELLKSEPPPQYQLLWALQSIPSNLTRLWVEDVIHQLETNNGGVLVNVLERDVIIGVSQRLKNDPAMIELLQSLDDRYTASMASSILHQMQIQWRPLIFDHCELLNAQFEKANWPKLWFTECGVFGSKFSESNLTESSFSKSKVHRCDFALSKLNGTNAFQTEFFNCDFSGSQLTRSTWKKNKVRETDFTDSSQAESTMEDTELLSSNFRRANLANARFENCYFTDCSFDEGNLTSLNAVSTIFVRCRLKHAKTDGAVFENCNLSDLNIEDTEHRNSGDWIARQTELYQSNWDSLPANYYFLQGLARLEGLQRWAQGRMKRLRISVEEKNNSN